MRQLATGLTWLALAAVAACKEPLSVPNRNNPDVERALSTPTGIEQLIATSYQQIFNGVHRNTVAPQLNAMSLESYGSVANFGMALRVAIPRGHVQNARGNQTATENFAVFSNMQRQARTIANGIAALDALVAGGGTLGTPVQNARGRAFAFFTLGLAHGYTSLVYDSASIVRHTTPTDEVPALDGYAAVNAAALQMMDSAIAIATSATVNASLGGFSMPDTWVRGNTLSRDAFVRVVRSFKARLRAGVARTPAERAAVNWDEVIADATNGITSDLAISLSVQAGWQNQIVTNAYRYSGWHSMAPFYIGMADTSGAYDAWLATVRSSRSSFLIKTPDQRFPSGETRPDQQAASGEFPNATTGRPYFRNRPSGEDNPADPWANSPYDHYRYRALARNNADNAGPWPDITKAEVDLLAAEGYLRKGDIATAAALIDRTRVSRGGLPALSGVVGNATDPVPGGAACVPRVPTGPSFTSTTCGNILEALKWEKRIEGVFTGWALWYFDSRGWGDLIEATALQYPVPYQEMDARGGAFYDSNQMVGPTAAAKGTYGF
jgi:hypothetical protein